MQEMNEKQLKENSSIHVFVVDFVGMQRSMRSNMRGFYNVPGKPHTNHTTWCMVYVYYRPR